MSAAPAPNIEDHNDDSILSQQPVSPNILDPQSPDSPTLPIRWQESAELNQDSETFTQADPNEDVGNPDLNDVTSQTSDTQSTVGVTDVANLNNLGYNHDVIDQSSSSSATINYEHENSDSNTFSSTSIWVSRIGRLGLSNVRLVETSTVSNEGSNCNDRLGTTETKSQSSSLLPDQVEKHEDEPPAKVRKLNSPKSDSDTDGETCPICLDSWANSGDHRLVALKCGHLFGSKCVEKWLRAQPMKERSCPTCKSKANVRDMRNIYAKRLVASDTSEITALQNQLEILQAEKNRTELELHKSKIAHRACIHQLESLRMLMKSQVTKESKRTWRFALEKNLEICKDGGCRVLTYNCRTYEFYISQKSVNNLFPGYGIRKVNCIDYKLGQFVHLHSKPIRDITYSQPRDLLLSVSLDGCAKIVERGIPGASILAEGPLWSCTWDYSRSDEFYVGGIGGHILQYDIRNSSSYLRKISVPTYRDLSPVVSLCSTEYGLLSCHLNSCWLWVQGNSGQWEPRSLPVEGPFMSLCYDRDSKRALVSCRSAHGVHNEAARTSRLSLCKFETCVQSGEVTCELEQTFSNSARSSYMTRASWVKVDGASWVASHSESDSALYLHGLDGVRTMTLPAAEPALDVCSAQLNSDTILAALSESRLRIYKAVSTSS